MRRPHSCQNGVLLTVHHDRPVLSFGGVTVIAAIVATDLTAPDGHKGARIAVGAAPGENVAVGPLHNGEDVPGALIGHGGKTSEEVYLL
jgi:hypothetical protein